MRINDAGLQLIKRFEGCRLEAYLCPANVWTIGFGHTGDVKAGRTISQHQADVILESDLQRFEEGVASQTRHCGLHANQFSALVSLAFNIGLANLANSTLLKKIQRGDMSAAADGFLMWTKARVGGQLTELPGLVKRRAAERALFLTVPS